MKIPTNDTAISDDSWDDNDREALVDGSKSPYETEETKPNPVIDCCVTSIASIHFLWIFRRTECLLAVALLFFVTIAVTGIVETYEDKKHNFKHHQFSHVYANVKSPLELKLGDIDHWCLDGRDDTCPRCDDPTIPISRGELGGWKHAFMRNVKLSSGFQMSLKQPDVVFLGDSIVEAMVGTFKGYEGVSKQGYGKSTPSLQKNIQKAAAELDSIKNLYEKKFTKANGGKYDAVKLGIAGDTAPNLLWRIKHKEMLNLQPDIWWVAVGRNDLFRTKCSEEVALIGIIRVIEELINRNDGATIVINSLLPISEKPTLQIEGHWFKNDMYKSIQEVNRRLKNFAMKHHHVVFFDANDVFVETKTKASKYIVKKYYANQVHPSYEGYKALSKAQIEFIDTIMTNREKKAAGEYGNVHVFDDGDMDDEYGDDADDNEDDDDYVKNSASKGKEMTVEDKKESYNDTAEDAEGNEYLDYDDYYNYEVLFDGGDDLLNDFSLYGDDYIIDDDW